MSRLAGHYEATLCPVYGCTRMHGARWVPTPRRGQDLQAVRLGGEAGGPAHTGPMWLDSLGKPTQVGSG